MIVVDESYGKDHPRIFFIDDTIHQTIGIYTNWRDAFLALVEITGKRMEHRI